MPRNRSPTREWPEEGQLGGKKERTLKIVGNLGSAALVLPAGIRAVTSCSTDGRCVGRAPKIEKGGKKDASRFGEGVEVARGEGGAGKKAAIRILVGDLRRCSRR